MADAKISQLPADTTPTSDDLIVTVNDPLGTPADKKVVLSDLINNLISPSWTSYNPTPTGLTVGNGTLTGSYVQIGKTVFFKCLLVWGSTTSAGVTNKLSLPVTAVAREGTVGTSIGITKAYDGTAQWEGPLNRDSTTTCILRWYGVQGTGIKDNNITSTSPNTWTTGAEFYVYGHYEAA